jgi:hypothetical protein
MSYNEERYKTAETIHSNEALRVLREHIGELEDFRSPTQTEVEDAIEIIFPALLTNEKVKIAEAFMKSEIDAANKADELTEN